MFGVQRFLNRSMDGPRELRRFVPPESVPSNTTTGASLDRVKELVDARFQRQQYREGQ